MDWNGDGRLDPVDVGISIATGEFLEEREEPAAKPPVGPRKPSGGKGLLGWLDRFLLGEK